MRAWIPQFHDRAAFDKNSEWQMRALVDGKVKPFTGSNGTEYFVNPLHPGVQAYERSIIKEVAANYDVDGIVLDWLRFDDYNMDMGDYTRTQYKNQYGYDPITINFASDNAKREEWNDWRTTKLGEYVRDVKSDLDGITPGLFSGLIFCRRSLWKSDRIPPNSCHTWISFLRWPISTTGNFRKPGFMTAKVY